MTSLKCLCFTVFISMLTLSAHAELEEIDDLELQEFTGQQGITIDIDSKLSIGESAYQDGKSGGFILVQGINVGGNDEDREIIFNNPDK